MEIDRRALFMPMIQEAIEKHREDESLQDLRIKYGEEDDCVAKFSWPCFYAII